MLYPYSAKAADKKINMNIHNFEKNFDEIQRRLKIARIALIVAIIGSALSLIAQIVKIIINHLQ